MKGESLRRYSDAIEAPYQRRTQRSNLISSRCSLPLGYAHWCALIPASLELEYQALWYSGAFGSTFRATNGSSVEILQFGFWNKESGPDFVHALIRVNGNQTLAGGIELVLSADEFGLHPNLGNPSFTHAILQVYVRQS